MVWILGSIVTIIHHVIRLWLPHHDGDVVEDSTGQDDAARPLGAQSNLEYDRKSDMVAFQLLRKILDDVDLMSQINHFDDTIQKFELFVEIETSMCKISTVVHLT